MLHSFTTAVGLQVAFGSGSICSHHRLLPLLLSLLQGWCVKTSEAIPQGRFVCEYAGEYVSGTEAEQRLAEYDKQDRGHALLVSQLTLPVTIQSLPATCGVVYFGYFSSRCIGLVVGYKTF